MQAHALPIAAPILQWVTPAGVRGAVRLWDVTDRFARASVGLVAFVVIEEVLIDGLASGEALIHPVPELYGRLAQ